MSSAPQTNRQILLARRPQGDVCDADFRLVEGPVPEPGEGQVLVRNLLLSLDPAIRGWMDEGESYVDPIPIGAPVRSGSLGEVVVSRHPRFAPGDKVIGLTAWEDLSVVRARMIHKMPSGPDLPLSAYLSVLGGNGLTAYFGLLEVGRPEAGQTVLVSAAAGGVGSIVGQLARIHGCRAVGIAGGPDKCRLLTEELGFDAAVDYKSTDNLRDAIGAACPDGVDVYFDSVGGAVLDAALAHITVGARVVLCGAMSQIQSPHLPAGPKNYIRLLTKRARMEGFVTLDFAARWPEGSERLGAWVASGELRYRDHVVEGLENTPEAFQMLFDGRNLGKLMVRVATPQSSTSEEA